MTDRYAQYRVERTIGRGATSEVYLAVVSGEHGFEPRVAVKCLRPEARDEVQIDRFIAEVQVTCHLRHPNVVSTIDFGVLDGTPFSVMEYVEGASVLELLQGAQARSERVPPAVALHIVREVAVALDYVHHATNPDGAPLRIVHRDIGPQNILVANTGHVKLADFSVARAFRRPRLTRVGQVRGTLDFMAPEQMKMEQITPQTDLFGLGCVMHALLVGHSPMGSDALRNEVVTGNEAPLDPSIDPDIAAIIRRAIRVRPKDRFANAAQMADACWGALRVRADREPRLQTAAWFTGLERTVVPKVAAAPRTQLIRLASKADGVRMFTSQQQPLSEPDLDETKHLGRIPGLDRTADLRPIDADMIEGPTSLIHEASESHPKLDPQVLDQAVDPVFGGPTLSEPADEGARRSMRGPALAMLMGILLGGVISLVLIPGEWLGFPDPTPVAAAPPEAAELKRRVEALRARRDPALAARLTELERRIATGDPAERRAVAADLDVLERAPR